MMRFTNPRDLYHGKGALEALKSLKRQEGCYLRGWRKYEEVWLPR